MILTHSLLQQLHFFGNKSLAGCSKVNNKVYSEFECSIRARLQYYSLLYASSDSKDLEER